MSLPRLLVFFSAALGAAGRLAAATPALSALPDLPKWSSSVSVQAAGGYKDNLLLSSVDPERSGFARYGVEAFLWHLPQGRTDYSAILSAEETRYFSGEAVDHEASAFAHFQWRYQMEEKFRFAFDVQGYYIDEIRDVSDTDVTRLVAELKVAGVNVGPSVRWSPRSWGWIELQAHGSRESFHDRSYDGKIGEGALRLGWKPGSRLELSVGGTDRRRRFDTRQQFTLGGLPVPNTLLVVGERESEARLEVTWDKDARWKATTRTSRLDYDDNGSGFFDYQQRRIAQILEWASEAWRINFEGAASRREFENQTVGRGVSPPIRIADEYSAELRFERKVSARWTAYGLYRWERNRSNEAIASYRVNEGLLGARWSWEK